MDWISGIVVTIVVIFFIAVMYKALKEPIDALFGLIATWFGYIKGKGEDVAGATVETIRYD